MADRFLIAPYDKDSGVQSNYKPWLIPDVAFGRLDNAYVWRGRVRKRFGTLWLGNTQQSTRLRVNIGTTAAITGNFAGNVPGAIFEIGQSFSIGNTLFTVYQNGAMLSTGVATGTYNTATGAVNITGNNENPSTTIYFYPAQPVMGLLTYNDTPTNFEPTIAFDTQFAYQYNNSTSGWERLSAEAVAGAATWTGSDSQFFWSTTWTGANAFEKIFFVTNFNQNEPNFLRYYDGAQWNNYNPLVSATDRLFSCRIITVFKNRLLAFNTWEGVASPGNNYQNRVRFSQVGSPLAVDAWRQDIPGKGGGIDAPTTEAIITVEFIKDRLIVYFEQSTWELVYTNNQIYPFAWQQINTELGVESTFSIIPWGNLAIGVGNTGIHACNGTNVERIDQKIPESVFEIRNGEEAVDRVYGIRDYFGELMYWTYANSAASATEPFPKRVFVYNYKTQTWAFNDDSITCFGYFQPQTGITWDSTTVTWDDPVSWDGGDNQPRFRAVIAGNQEGWTFYCGQDFNDNAPALQITNITFAGQIATVISVNHNLRAGSYIFLDQLAGSGNITSLNQKIFQAINIVDADTFTFVTTNLTIVGTYTGGGVIALVPQIRIDTKQYNFYARDGRNTYLSKVDFLVDVTSAGSMEVQFLASTSGVPLLDDSMPFPLGNGSLLGTGNLETFAYNAMEQNSQRTWHPVYFQAEGQVVQFRITMNDEQMRTVLNSRGDFQMHAIMIYAQPTTARFE